MNPDREVCLAANLRVSELVYEYRRAFTNEELNQLKAILVRLSKESQDHEKEREDP